MNIVEKYRNDFLAVLQKQNLNEVIVLAQVLKECWQKSKRVFICGNGGSAANAMHLANDLLYGIGERKHPGIAVQALSSNSSILTCLANDLDFKSVFSQQLKTQGRKGDLLIVLSGSGNSPNIIEILKVAREMHIQSAAILGFDGGQALNLSDIVLHLEINDMQFAEDFQLIVGHMLMKWLKEHSPFKEKS